MAEAQTRKIITLRGKLITPLVSPSHSYNKMGCWVRIVGDLESNKKARFTTVGKLVKGERKPPTVLRSYRGFVKISCVDYSEKRGRQKIGQFLEKQFLGRYTSEGFGKVQWIDCRISDFNPSFLPKNPDALPITERYCPSCNSMIKVCYWSSLIQGSYASFYRCTTCNHIWRGKQLKIRKGLGANYPEKLLRLIQALLLHDFVHTEKHQSKIYEQINIEDEEIREVCLNHHAENNSNNDLLTVLQYYDGLASGIGQQKPFKSYSRYDYEEGKIDFKELARVIEEQQQFIYKLYQFIYHSEDLERTVKSMNYEGSLRNHLLLMVNLAIDDWRDGRLIITTKGQLKITEKKKKVLPSATKSEEVALSAMDAEMYPFLTMNNAESESPSNSMKEEAWNIGGEKPTKEKVGRRLKENGFWKHCPHSWRNIH